MSSAVTTLARTTVLDAVGDTAGSAPSLHPPTIDNAAIEGLLRRGRRWRMPTNLGDGVPPLVIEPQVSADSWRKRLRRSRRPAVSFVVSLAVHVIVLLIAALVVVSADPSIATTLMVNGSMPQADQEELVEWEAPLAQTVGPIEDKSEPAALTAVELDPGAMQAGTPQIALMDIQERDVAGPLGDIVGALDGTGGGLATSGDGSGGDENDAGQEGAEFFGVQAAGRKFIFVCDCSGSMAGLKWAELHRELSRCIGTLGPGKAFYAIFFDGEMHPMFEPFSREPVMLDATADNVEKVREWIASKSLGPNTSPYESMKFAAKLEPDAIFLLTDGEFSDYTAPYLRDFNKKRVAKGKPKIVVHTIGFFSQKHQMVLERIAKDSGGTYQFVEGPKPVKPKRKSQNVIAPPIGVPNFGGPGVPAGAQQGAD